jgi:hypothetical protein
LDRYAHPISHAYLYAHGYLDADVHTHQHSRAYGYLDAHVHIHSHSAAHEYPKADPKANATPTDGHTHPLALLLLVFRRTAPLRLDRRLGLCHRGR